MTDHELVSQVLRMAKTLADDTPQAKPIQARSRKAYGLIRDPNKVIKNMKDKGIALNYDGSLWTWMITPFGVPNYSKSPNLYAGNAEKAASKTKKISDSLRVKHARYKQALDDITRYKRMLMGMKVTEDTIADMKFLYKEDISEYINKRVRDPKLKSINSELESIAQKVEDGDFDGAVKNVKIIQDIIAGDLLEKWQGQLDFFQKQRKVMLEIARMLSKNAGIAAEIATVGTPPKDEVNDALDGPTMQLSADQGEKRIVLELKRLIKLRGVAEFNYTKKDGSSRSVRVSPTDIRRTGKGPMIVGYDLDRKDERNFLLSGVS